MEKAIHFPRWAEVLGASDLPEQTRESFKVTLRWYLGWCHRRSLGCRVQSARDFVDWAQKTWTGALKVLEHLFSINLNSSINVGSSIMCRYLFSTPKMIG